MFHVQYQELYLSIDALSHSQADDIFAAAQGSFRISIQHLGDKP